MQRVVSGLEEKEQPFVDVLDHLRCARLKLKLSKCHFLRQSVEYLGYLIIPEGLKPNPAQVVAVREFPTPTLVTGGSQTKSCSSGSGERVSNSDFGNGCPSVLGIDVLLQTVHHPVCQDC